LTCDERRDLLLLYAADALEDVEASDLRAHLATGCPTCAGALAEAKAVIGNLPLALPPVTPPDSARAKLMAKVRSVPAASRRPAASSPMRLFPIVIASAIAACLSAIVVGAALWLPARAKARLVDSSHVQLVSLGGGEPQPHASGRIFWDRQSDKWHVVVFDLKPPAAGKEYELWFITPEQKKVPAGMFTVDRNGSGSIDVKLPANIGPIALAAVTDEPIGGVAQPTGSIQLAGAVK